MSSLTKTFQKIDDCIRYADGYFLSLSVVEESSDLHLLQSYMQINKTAFQIITSDYPLILRATPEYASMRGINFVGKTHEALDILRRVIWADFLCTSDEQIPFPEDTSIDLYGRNYFIDPLKKVKSDHDGICLTLTSRRKLLPGPSYVPENIRNLNIYIETNHGER